MLSGIRKVCSQPASISSTFVQSLQMEQAATGRRREGTREGSTYILVTEEAVIFDSQAPRRFEEMVLDAA